MIIMESLYKMAKREGLDYYRPFMIRSIEYAISINKNGRSVGVTYPDGGPWSEKEKSNAFYIECLRDANRTSGVSTNPLYDMPKCIFPSFFHKTDGKENEARTMELKASFRQKVQMIYDNTQDEAVKAVLLYLGRLDSGKETFPSHILNPEDCETSWFTFYYQPTDEYVMYRPAVREFWKTYILHQEGKGQYQCCVTGEMVDKIMPVYPKVLGLPGTNGGGSPIASANKDAFVSFGLKKNENFPYSGEVIEILSIAISRMCSSRFPKPGSCYPKHTVQEKMPSRSIRLNPTTVFCFWSDSEEAMAFAENMGAILEVNPDGLKDQTWKKMWKGKMPSQPGDIGHHNCEYIYGMIFVGADRPMFQSIIMHPVLELQRNITQHFLDTNISRTATSENRGLDAAFGIYWLLSSCLPTKNEKSQDPLSRTIVAYVQAIMEGTSYPTMIVNQAEERYPKEFHNANNKKKTWLWRRRMDCCAAIIKGHINRQIRLGKTTTNKEFTEHMDHTRTDPAYALGCALAIANGLQAAANGKRPNKTLAEDLLFRCKSSPMDGYEKISEKVIHYLAKIRRIESRWGLYLTRLWNFWQSNVEGNLPEKFNSEQRHSFLLGFHQTYAWINNIDLRRKWLNQEGVPDILKLKGIEQKLLEEEEIEQEKDIDLTA
jgi:CRISPR-associated protein Cas8c/Csd1 subtype I-C